MFNMLDLFKKKPGLTLDEVAELLKTRPECITEFEKAYAAHALSQDVTEKDNLFDVNAKEAASLHAGIEIRPEEMEQMIIDYKVALPPFCHFTPQEWEDKGHEYDEIRDNMLWKMYF